MFEHIFSIIGIACIGVLWIESEPTIRLREYLLKDKSTWYFRLLNCAMCSSFWIGMILTLNIYDAAIISILAELIDKKLNNR
jgi:hypothetical protein